MKLRELKSRKNGAQRRYNLWKKYIYTYNFQQFETIGFYAKHIFPVKTTLMIQKKINVT